MRICFAILITAMLGCSATAVPVQFEADQHDHRLWLRRPTVPDQRVATVPRADLDVPDTCDRLLVVMTPSGPQLSKQRAPWLRDGKARTAKQQWLRKAVAVVADEMGADPLAAEMLWRKAILESSGHPGNVHIHTADQRANITAARRGRERSSARWAKAKVPVYQQTRRGLREVGSRDAWALGRGLYGQVTGLHLHRWGDDVPPWSLCDPLIATVSVIWSMRAGLAECHGSTLRDAYRRFSSGKCALRSDDRERAFDRLARGSVRGLSLPRFDPDAPAVFGSRWSEQSTDRAVLLAKLRQRVVAEVGESP